MKEKKGFQYTETQHTPMELRKQNSNPPPKPNKGISNISSKIHSIYHIQNPNPLRFGIHNWRWPVAAALTQPIIPFQFQITIPLKILALTQSPMLCQVRGKLRGLFFLVLTFRTSI